MGFFLSFAARTAVTVAGAAAAAEAETGAAAAVGPGWFANPAHLTPAYPHHCSHAHQHSAHTLTLLTGVLRARDCPLTQVATGAPAQP